MSKTILQINYQFTTTYAEHVAMVTPAAEMIAATPGLVWKVWLANEAAHEGGGIYLFESREAAQGFVNSPAMVGFAGSPVISNFNAKYFGTNEALDAITRAPLTLAIPA